MNRRLKRLSQIAG